MIIAVDIGNTNIVVGGIEADHVLFTERLSTRTDKTELEYAIDFAVGACSCRRQQRVRGEGTGEIEGEDLILLHCL